MISPNLVKKYELDITSGSYVLSVPDVMVVLKSLITSTIDMVSSKYISIVLDVTIVLKGPQLLPKGNWGNMF